MPSNHFGAQQRFHFIATQSHLSEVLAGSAPMIEKSASGAEGTAPWKQDFV